MKWTEEQIRFLVENYAKKGKAWCMSEMGLTEGQIRAKASALNLKANGVSEAWHAKNKAHAQRLTGKKRPAQVEVIKALQAQGKLDKTDSQRKALSERSKAWIAANGHPRGALGLKHSDEAKAAIGSKSKDAWSRKSEDQIAQRTMKMMRTREAKGGFVNERPQATWKAAWREIGGVRKYYRSKWEANYARYLEWLKKGGHIKDWAHEPQVFWFDGIKRGCVSYLPDFRVVESNGAESFHEVKGWMDDRSKTKIQRMAKYHPSVTLIVVDSKAYAEIKRKVSSLVPGWEE